MIKIGNIVIETNHFPDNTLLMKAPDTRVANNSVINIEWKYENDAELFTLICLRKHYSQAKVILWLPYCPHARMDRVKDKNDIFTLKYFAEVINSLNFMKVNILDPHSNVCIALLNNVNVLNPKPYIEQTFENCKPDLLFYPDEGAMKRYSDTTTAKYAFGIKKRDWTTGKIEGLEVMGCINEIKDKKILIIDDICSRGGTFYHSAKRLKELGAKEIYLYITHCENTILEGELLTSGLIEKVYTTNSIFTKEHEKIEVFEI